MLARDFPGHPGMVARAKRADAWARWHQARLVFLGTDHPLYFDEFVDGFGVQYEIRYGRPVGTVPGPGDPAAG